MSSLIPWILSENCQNLTLNFRPITILVLVVIYFPNQTDPLIIIKPKSKSNPTPRLKINKPTPTSLALTRSTSPSIPPTLYHLHSHPCNPKTRVVFTTTSHPQLATLPPHPPSSFTPTEHLMLPHQYTLNLHSHSRVLLPTCP